MKRTTILLLTIAIALMAASGAYAKRKAYKSGSNSLPSAQLFVKFYENDNDNINIPSFKMIAQKSDEKYYGNNVTITFDTDGNAIAKATGPHAFYITPYKNKIYFKSKADRDKIIANKFFRDFGCCGAWTDTENGWYIIGLGH